MKEPNTYLKHWDDVSRKTSETMASIMERIAAMLVILRQQYRQVSTYLLTTMWPWLTEHLSHAKAHVTAVLHERMDPLGAAASDSLSQTKRSLQKCYKERLAPLSSATFASFRAAYTSEERFRQEYWVPRYRATRITIVSVFKTWYEQSWTPRYCATKERFSLCHERLASNPIYQRMVHVVHNTQLSTCLPVSRQQNDDNNSRRSDLLTPPNRRRRHSRRREQSYSITRNLAWTAIAGILLWGEFRLVQPSRSVEWMWTWTYRLTIVFLLSSLVYRASLRLSCCSSNTTWLLLPEGVVLGVLLCLTVLGGSVPVIVVLLLLAGTAVQVSTIVSVLVTANTGTNDVEMKARVPASPPSSSGSEEEGIDLDLLLMETRRTV